MFSFDAALTATQAIATAILFSVSRFKVSYIYSASRAGTVCVGNNGYSGERTEKCSGLESGGFYAEGLVFRGIIYF